MKRKKRNPKSLPALRAKLDSLFSLYVRIRDKRKTGGWCLVCGTRPIQVCSHILPKGDFPGVRWDENNALGSCSACNYREMMHRGSERLKFISIIGKDRYEILESLGRERRYGKEDIEKAIEYYEFKLANSPKL